MKKMFNHFYEWLWHVSVRRDNLYRHKKSINTDYRYPSPGSVMIQKKVQDYRTPFNQSQYNVRFANLTQSQVREEKSEVQILGFNYSPEQKLVILKLLKQQDINNSNIVNEAKMKFKSLYGFPVENVFHKNQLFMNRFIPTDKEGMKRAYETQILLNLIQRQNNESNYSKEQRQNQTPDAVQFESLDLYDLPHIQQSQVQLHYVLDKIQQNRAAAPFVTREGSRNFWKSLDDSNDLHEIEKVQGAIKDENPTDFSIKYSRVKLEFDENGNVVDIHRIKEKKSQEDPLN